MRSLAMGGLLLVGGPGLAFAQGVLGLVVDSTGRQPVAEAAVSLVAADQRVAARATTDQAGRYQLSVASPGWYHLEIQRVGFRRYASAPFELKRGVRRGIETRLAALPVELDPIEVTESAPAERPSLTRVGFYERQRSDFGRFITRDEIAERQARRFTELMGMVPGVRVLPGVGGAGRYGLQLRGSRISEGGVCQPRVYVDGLVMIRGDAEPRVQKRGVPGDPAATEVAAETVEHDEIAVDDLVLPDDIEGIEVYRSSAQVPARFGGSSTVTQCGVIVIWTRRGGGASN